MTDQQKNKSSKNPLPCPVCGQKFKNLEQHIRRKNDQAHRQWRQNAEAAAHDPAQNPPDNPGAEPHQQEQPEQNQQAGQDPEQVFQGTPDNPAPAQPSTQQTTQGQYQQVGQHQGQGQMPAVGSGNGQQGGQQEPFEHDCDGHPGKAQFYEKKPNCPRCGKTLAWDKAPV